MIGDAQRYLNKTGAGHQWLVRYSQDMAINKCFENYIETRTTSYQ